MRSVAIIGGGRWARTIAEVLCRLQNPPLHILLHSRLGADSVRRWIGERGLSESVAVSDQMPDLFSGAPSAAIIANRAGDHARTSALFLDAGVPVLVEKPVAIGAENVKLLQNHAASSGALLAASHVMMFARYFNSFASLVTGQGPILSLEAVWEDGAGDVVRGEAKQYDPAVCVFDDVLPHVLPLLGQLAQQELKFSSVALAGGGARVKIDATAGAVPVTVHLARNAAGRRREISVMTAEGPFVLDFSSEPGTVLPRGQPGYNGDPLWESAARPLGSMLASFLQSIDAGTLDPRLSADLALSSALFADDVRARYQEQQRTWLATDGIAPTSARDYAQREISASSG